jgi:hypothetical protein
MAMVFHFPQYFNYIVVVSFIGWGNRSTRKKQAAQQGTETLRLDRYDT